MPGSGERIQRRFRKTDMVQMLYDFVDSIEPERLQFEDHGNGYVIL